MKCLSIFIVFFFLSLGLSSPAKADEADEAVSSVGAGKAVLEAKEGLGFKLSEAAMKTLEVKLETVTARGAVFVPASSIANLKGETGVYRLRQGYFKLIEGEVSDGKERVRFVPQNTGDVIKGDQIAITAVPLLRVTELDVMGEGDEDEEESESQSEEESR